MGLRKGVLEQRDGLEKGWVRVRRGVLEKRGGLGKGCVRKQGWVGKGVC